MKKYLIILVFFFILNSNVLAEWTEIGKMDEPKGKFYIDIKTLTDDGEYLYVWTLRDFEKPIKKKGKFILSGKVFEKIDCNPKRAAGIQYLFYEGGMGSGKVDTFQRDQLKWNYFPPGSIMGNAIDALCDNR